MNRAGFTESPSFWLAQDFVTGELSPMTPGENQEKLEFHRCQVHGLVVDRRRARVGVYGQTLKVELAF
jgi:hypothetical protein